MMVAKRNPAKTARAWGLSALAIGLAAGPAGAGSWEIGDSFPAPSSQTNGLAWDGQALWHSNDRNPIVYRIDSHSGKVLSTQETQVRDQGDMEYAAGGLWVVSEDDHYVKMIGAKGGPTLDSIKVLGIPDNPPDSRFPIYQLEGLAYDGRNLWTDGDHSTIIRIDLKTRKQYKYEMPYEMGYLDGMAWAFDHLWVVTNNATIYEIDPCSMGILDQFAAPANVSAGPEGFAFDGENLWFADNDRDEIYKIILKDKLLTKRAARTGACKEGTLLVPEAVSLPGDRAAPAPRRHAYPGAPAAAWKADGRGLINALGRAMRADANASGSAPARIHDSRTGAAP